jgi:hypothetical protein
MTDADFDERIAGKISLTTINTGKQRAALDWEHIKDLRSLSPDFRLLFEWVAHCLSQKRAYTFLDFEKIRKIEQHFTAT